MLSLGWDKKPGVRVVFGRWQDVIEEVGAVRGWLGGWLDAWVEWEAVEGASEEGAALSR